MTDTNKYLPVHVDVYDATMRMMVENGLSKDLLKTHRVSHIVRLDGDRWLVRLEYSVMKESGFGNAR